MNGRGWSVEFARLALGAIACGAAGALFGRPAWWLLGGLALYGAWHALQLRRLERALRGGGRVPGAAPRGAWYDLYSALERLQRKNRKRKKRLARIVESFQQAATAVPDGAVVLREQDEIAWLNGSAATLLGLRPGQDIGRPIGNLVRAPSIAEYLAHGAYRRALEIDSPVDPNVKLSIRVVPYAGNRRLLLARDVTRLHRLEMMRRDFVANVSHELRSPLTVIKGYLETLEDDIARAPREWVRSIEILTQQSNRMCTIVDDLLALSRLENAPGAAAHDPVDVAGMLGAILVEARGLSAGRHRIALEAEEGLTLLGDYGELYSAFSNIVFNAVRYTPQEGDIVLALGSAGEGARVSVRDTGIGIDPEHIPRLTERFYRVDKARSREAGGTGLGLAIVKHVLVHHEAHLEIESEQGRGSTFACVFPPARVRRAPVPAVAGAEEAASSGG